MLLSFPLNFRAIQWRERSDFHKRLMLLATGASFFRRSRVCRSANSPASGCSAPVCWCLWLSTPCDSVPRDCESHACEVL